MCLGHLYGKIGSIGHFDRYCISPSQAYASQLFLISAYPDQYRLIQPVPNLDYQAGTALNLGGSGFGDI